MTARTILVCGLPRCGSSLTMAMLASAGLETIGAAPGYEDERTFPTRVDLQWLHAQEGRAIKLLDPELLPLHALQRDRFAAIFLTRDAKQQMLSGLKFSRWQGLRPSANRKARLALAAGIERDTAAAIKMLRATGNPLLVFPFERLVRLPDVAAGELVDFLEPYTGRLNPYLMSRLVMRRPVGCLPYMLEDGLIADAAARPA